MSFVKVCCDFPMTIIVDWRGVVLLGCPVFSSLSNCIICFTKDLFAVKRFENEKIISEGVGNGK